MASNDSGAAVAATVNAVTPILPPSQAENKGQEATQANHNAAPSTTTTEAKAALPALSDPSPVTAKEVPKNDSSSVPASSNTSTSSIPSSKATETNASSSASSQPVDTASSESQSKPTEDKASAADSTTAKPATDTATSKTSNLSENKKEENNKKENKESETIPEQEEKKTDQKTPTPSADGDKAKTDKTEQKATNESPSPNTNIDNKISAEKPSVSGSEAGKSDNTQDATSTATVESPQLRWIPQLLSQTQPAPMDTSTSKSNTTSSNAKSNNKRPAEDGDDTSSDKKIKSSSSASSSSGGQKEGNKSAKEVFEYMDKTFEQRRKIITKQMPTIPELKSMYPELFMCKQLLLEFQRITKIDIDQKIQEFCVRYATAVIEMARSNKAAAPVLARWEKAKQENETLKQYWDMVTALCLLPLHFGENFVEMVLEIEEDEEVKAQGKIVPTLVARGNIFRTDEFFLIAENTIVQEFEEFTIAFASLYSSYWVFNMVYPETIENTYNYIQRCIVRQREPGAISAVCKNFTKSLQKWNKEKEGK